MPNYTLADFFGTFSAAALLALFLLPPGYLAAYVTNLLEFRRRSAAEQLLWSVILSISIAPILAVLLARFTSLTVTVAMFLLLAAAAIVLVVREPRAARWGSIERSTWIGLGIMAGWALLGTFLLVDLQFGGKLYLPYSAWDHNLRTMLVDAVARTGVPPSNPINALGGATPLRYYYYWYVLCALPVHLAGLSPRASLNGSVLWSGLALAALLPIYLKYYLEERENLRFKTLTGFALLLVTGLDLIPYLAAVGQRHVLLGDLEWWDNNQVTSWLGSVVWVPHHLAGAVACLTGFLLLITLPRDADWRRRTSVIVLAGFAFGSAAGLSLYVTFVFAIFLAVWALVEVGRGGPGVFFTYLGAGAFSGLLSLPYLLDLRGGPSRAGSRFAALSLRTHPLVAQLLQHFGIAQGPIFELGQFVGMLVVYFFEFGFFAAIAWVWFHRQKRAGSKLDARQLSAWVMLAVCLVVVSFVASDTTGSNDLGFRGVLIAQFMLLLWAVPIVAGWFRPGAAEANSASTSLGKALLVACLAIGALGTFVQLGLLRFYAPVVDAGLQPRGDSWMGPSPELGRHTLQVRRSAEQLRAAVPKSWVLQYNPVGDDLVLLHLYTERQVAAGDDTCGTTFGGDLERCGRAYPYFDAAFNHPEAARDWDMNAFCAAFHMDALVATSADRAWRDRESWVWTRTPLVQSEVLRVIPCRGQGGQ